ncbi:hypothetical protein F7R91_11650 [Streptomyces luteolifulvus]|uniref:Uncharacterized protein n=1 Tax=Streptomyces luteolifulvus TaxID=2615112 RepID=A0A6H9V4K7_9ACTN|nr:hypothetical protein [Streptomyces luteolifulvus]KAB1147733.1 hypothetical protein F7R91_11650 [Streptomyces luteolifulvus]
MLPSSETSAPDWRECRIDLPSPESWLTLDLDTDEPESWALSVAEAHLGPDVAADWHQAFAQDVLWYWVGAVRQRALCAALLAPPNNSVIASYTVRELRIPNESLNLDALHAEGERAAGPYFGSPGIVEVELPLGPALRVHRLEPTDPDLDHGSIVEGVAHYVLPQAYATALECRLLWASLGLGEELGRMADELAASIRLV